MTVACSGAWHLRCASCRGSQGSADIHITHIKYSSYIHAYLPDIAEVEVFVLFYVCAVPFGIMLLMLKVKQDDISVKPLAFYMGLFV